MIPSLAFRYQHQCLVAYKDLTHYWLLLPMLGLGLEMPLPWSAEDGSGFDASAFHLGSPQCRNEESGVVGRPPQRSVNRLRYHCPPIQRLCVLFSRQNPAVSFGKHSQNDPSSGSNHTFCRKQGKIPTSEKNHKTCTFLFL